MNKKIKYILLFVLVITLFTLWLLWANKALTTREFTIEDEKIPSSFDGFRIAHVSDLHNESFGRGNEKLLSLIKEANPDIIALTGDIIDSSRDNVRVVVEFITKALEIAPIYYVTGNHEPRYVETTALLNFIEETGVEMLDNESLLLTRGDDNISLYGINDPSFVSDYLLGDEPVVSSVLERLEKKDGFSILLSHRPEFFELYTEYGFDLVLSGHAHGGQFRFPFIGGLFAPGQGFLPEYDSGLYEEGNTSMIVSRGLGNSTFPLRFNNRPEVIFITLKEAQ